MKKKSNKSAFFNPRALIGLVLCLLGAALSLFAIGALPTEALVKQDKTISQGPVEGRTSEVVDTPNGPAYVHRDFQQGSLTKTDSWKGDVRKLPFAPALNKIERRELEEPQPNPRLFVPPGGTSMTTTSSSDASNGSARAKPSPSATIAPGPSPAAPAPTPSIQFDGLDFATWGAGHPPDENGDVGPTYYIQTVNTSIGIYQKSNGTRVAAFTFNTFFNGHFGGNLCETQNFGDPVVVYDSFEDRWVITDFAFTTDVNGNITSNVFQCFAVSQSGDPVNGGWNFYSFIEATGGAINDYPKLGIWPDGLYMSANLFNASGAGTGTQVWAFNKAQMYAGAPTVQFVTFLTPDTSEFTLIPANARLQTGSPPAGTPEYFVSTWEFLNAQEVYKFAVNWNSISTSTLTGPFSATATTVWPNSGLANSPVPSPGNALDPLQIRNMFSTMYSNLSGVESLWAAHTVQRNTAASSTTAVTGGSNAPRWYQIPVTGGTVGNDTNAWTFDPDGANTNYRYNPSLAVDRAGDMAMGYTLSSSAQNPSIRYAGRLSTDGANQNFSQTEQVMINGTGTQTGNCGPSACARWGDYSRMALDPDGCTFWYTNEYYTVNGLNDLTRIGAFKFGTCTPVGNGGTVSGTVTDASNSQPLSGASVMLGTARTASTNGSGAYSFSSIPAGTYTQGMSASFPGYTTGTAASETVTDSGTTTQNFALNAAPTSGCPVDNSTATFQTGSGTNIDMVTNPNQVILLNTPTVDQSVTTNSGSGFGFTNTSWVAQTFTAGVTGQLTSADVFIFCSGCSGTNPSITLSLRASSGTGQVGLPTGSDLASTTIAGFNDNAAGGYHGATFSSPPTLTSGTQYALVVRASATRTGTYAYTITNTSGSNPYTGGRRATSTTSGTSWTGTTSTVPFHTYMQTGYSAHSPGNFVSSAKDANPATGSLPTWGNLTWTATTPASTNVQFQAAASNNAAGVFNFVGPDGTANTFFSNGGSLAQFNGNRFLRYKAILTSSSTANTPALTNATLCFTDLAPAPVLQSVVSRITHGNGAGTFDLPLSTSSRFIEPRSDGTGNYKIVFNFDKPVNSGTANATAPSGGSVSSVTFSGSSMIVNLSGVVDQQTVTVTTSGVAGIQTQSSAPSVQIGFLQGDVTEDSFVNAGDTIVVRNNAGVTLDNTNFQNDVNADGQVDVGDTTIVRNNSGHFLP
jgi:Carboxypeptidase regulatory-like domain